MPNHQECHCFFNALGFFIELEFYNISSDALKAAYKKASLACHPDKNSHEDKNLATRAQQTINQAKELLSDHRRCFNYLDNGTPPEEFDHKCEEMKPVLDFISERMEPKKPASPEPSPPRQEHSSSNTSDFNILDDEEDEAGSLFNSPNKSGSSEKENKRRGRRKSIFEPKGYQLKGGKVTLNKHRTQGSVYKMEWAEKPGYSSWLTEEDLVKYYPREAQEYLDQLKREKSKRLSAIIKKAGPITEFL